MFAMFVNCCFKYKQQRLPWQVALRFCLWNHRNADLNHNFSSSASSSCLSKCLWSPELSLPRISLHPQLNQSYQSQQLKGISVLCMHTVSCNYDTKGHSWLHGMALYRTSSYSWPFKTLWKASSHFNFFIAQSSSIRKKQSVFSTSFQKSSSFLHNQCRERA